MFSRLYSMIFMNQGPWGGGNQGGGNPWGQRPANGPGGSKGPDEDPDLDAVLRQAQDRFKNAFGGGKSGGAADMPPAKALGILFIAGIVIWLGTGFYRVQPAEDAVILTFGKWTNTRDEAGLGYALPWPIQEIVKVDVAFDRRVEVGFRDKSTSRSNSNDIPSESLMLTGDENIIDIDFVVLWRVGDAGKYLFQIRDPETTVKKVAESAMREVIGKTQIQRALTEARAEVEAGTKELMQKMLDDYQSGVVINNVQLLKVDPPAAVVDAFDDVQRARADRERSKNEAETYRNDIVPKARGEAQKLVQEAEAYKQAVTSKAQGESERFLSVYAAYAQAKDVTQKRIYLETMQQIMQQSKKIIVGNDKGAPLLPYLPLDQLKSASQKQ